MKKLLCTGIRLFLFVLTLAGSALTATAQYSGTNLETGGLYTAMTKDKSNNIYVTRVTPSTSGATYEVEMYTGGTGTPAVLYTGLTHEISDFPWGLAVTSKGNIFISTDFSTEGGSIIELTKGDGSYTPSTYQTGHYVSALAVDASDNLYTAEYNVNIVAYEVVEYPANSASNPTGTVLYNGLKSAAGYTYPTGLVVATNGDVYVADAFSNDPSITDGGHVYKLTAASSYAVSTISTGNYSTALRLDNSGNLYSLENRGSGYGLIRYAAAAGAGVPIFSGLHTNGIYYPWGLAVVGTSKIFLDDGDDGTNGGAVIQLYLTPPTVTTTAATPIAATTATLNGVVNDNGNITNTFFIYGTSSTLAGATTTKATTGGTINAGSGNTPVACKLTGLTGSTTYYYAVSATNSGGTTQGSILSLLTAPTLSYSSPRSFYAGQAITPMTPVSTTVPAPAYGAPVIEGSGFSTPFSVAADVSGNVYVDDYGNRAIKEIPAGGGAPITLLTGFTTNLGVAVDAAGNIYVADAGSTVVNEYLAGTTSPITIGTGFNSPYGIAVDLKGNVYVADFGASAVYKIPAGGGTKMSIGTGFASPTGVAPDAAGNVYVADYGNGVVKEIQINGGATVSVGSGFQSPVGVAVDPAGNVFVADYAGSAVDEIPAGGGATIAVGSGYTNPTGVAVDGFGKLNVANYLASNIEQLTPVGGYYLSTFLPAGLTINSATGVISGTPATISPATNYRVTAYNTTGGTSTTVNLAIIANPLLAKLAVSNVTISPAFLSNTTSYTASVANSVSSVTVTPTTSDPAATVTVNGVAVPSGTPSGAIALGSGANTTITTIVTAQDGTTTKTYTITIARAPSSDAGLANLAVTPGTLMPAFATGTTSYTVAAGSAASIKITPTADGPGAKITVNGKAVVSGSASGPITLSPGANTVTVVVTAQDGITQQTYTVTVGQGSNDAYLSTLSVQTATLSPAFAFKTLSYTSNVPNSTTSVTVTPAVLQAGATVTVNGVAVANKTASGAIALALGSNTITIVVTAPDGVTTTTYTLVITRALSSNDNLSNLTTSIGTLSPAFSSGTTSYTVAAGSAASIKITPTVADPTATVTVNGTAVVSGSASGPITLNPGPNTISVVVTAQDGVTQQTYTVVAGQGGNDAYLSSLTVQTATLSPTFAFKTLSYTASVPNATSSVTITPALLDATASGITVNGAPVANKTASAPVSLIVGLTAISVVVTAQDGVTTQTYTITITRAAASNAYLASLSVKGATLSPTFAFKTLAYTSSVANATSSVTVTPSLFDVNASVTVNGTAVANKTASGPIDLAIGSNTITIVVTAGDGVTTLTYTVTITRASGGADSYDPGLSVNNPGDKPSFDDDIIAVHQGVSPNGDGINDFLVIDGILAYPDNKLMIMNRNGQLVFEAKGYDNTTRVFDGHSNKNGQMQLPGTYFYQLDYTVNGTTKHKTGFIVLKY